ERVLELFDRYEHVRQLGTGGRGPSGVAAAHVFKILCRGNRQPEAARFISDDAAFHSPSVVRALLDEGTSLLRREQPAMAEPMFNTLWRGLARRKAELLDVPDDDWNDVRR